MLPLMLLQSEYNLLRKLGGNPPLTEHGREYSKRLGKFAEEVVCKNEQGGEEPARLWTR
jgi:broad specificity phosphatase PhoE